ncbi:hypothetical protein [Ammoniphilus sp. YIM 78166]|uniref:hypothetical protein n=1 Tax=Ammoniphilus sp. YIM 78166 TaxID=1644106 RepID=UPI00106FA6AE|nr:hypothetical protein [Ammoniphilus sp. YIM 78166]
MSSVVERIKRAFSSLEGLPVIQQAIKSTTASVSIPITASMIQATLNQSQLKDFEKIQIQIDDTSLILRGEVRKLMIKVPFSVTLQPVSTQDGKLVFALSRMSPLNASWINQKIFHHPPYLFFKDGLIYLDLEPVKHLEQLQGKFIHHIEIKDGTLWINIRTVIDIQKQSK